MSFAVDNKRLTVKEMLRNIQTNGYLSLNLKFVRIQLSLYLVSFKFIARHAILFIRHQKNLSVAQL